MIAASHARTIGLTGNIASGKSSVARRLAEHGATVIDADLVAHEVMRPELPAWRAVVGEFGRDILNADGEIHRPRLRSIVFNDPAALQRLNRAVHPYVHAELLQRIRRLGPGEVAVIEAVALVEAGTYRELDSLWLVLCPPQQQIARLVQSRHLQPEDAAWRVAAQPPAEPKAALAEVVIRNDGGLDELFAATDRAWEETRMRWERRPEEGTTA